MLFPIVAILLLWAIVIPRFFICVVAATLCFGWATDTIPQDLLIKISSWAASESINFRLEYDLLSDPMTVMFILLLAFRYLRLLVHIVSFWVFYRPAPVPDNPTLFPSDCTIILPTVDPKNPDFKECINSCLLNRPGAIIVVTVGGKLTKLTKNILAPFKRRFPNTSITVKTADEANKRRQVAHGLQFMKTKITILLDDHVFWPSERFLPTILAPFEDPKVGICRDQQTGSSH